ncbi:MAG: PfkB family carbohydrate kinase, partial [Chitinophagales bacterium]
IPVAVDPKKDNFFAYQLCTLFKPNLREVKESLHVQINPENIESLNEAASILHKHLHNGITLITLGEKGIYLRSGNEVFTKAAHIRNVADVSGAGDTVISIAALCLAVKTPLDMLAALSNLAGGIVCEYPGVVSISKDTLLEEALQVL